MDYFAPTLKLSGRNAEYIIVEPICISMFEALAIFKSREIPCIYMESNKRDSEMGAATGLFPQLTFGHKEFRREDVPHRGRGLKIIYQSEAHLRSRRDVILTEQNTLVYIETYLARRQRPFLPPRLSRSELCAKAG